MEIKANKDNDLKYEEDLKKKKEDYEESTEGDEKPLEYFTE